MSVEEIKKRFVNEIKLRAYDDKYIDKNEEREILQIAIQLGVNIDSARSALVQVCEEQGYIVESVILKMMKDQVETASGNDGKVDQKEFELIFGERHEGDAGEEKRAADQDDDRPSYGRHRQQQNQNRLVQRLVRHHEERLGDVDVL